MNFGSAKAGGKFWTSFLPMLVLSPTSYNRLLWKAANLKGLSRLMKWVVDVPSDNL